MEAKVWIASALGAPAKQSTGASEASEADEQDMHPKKVTVLKVTGVDLVTLLI